MKWYFMKKVALRTDYQKKNVIIWCDCICYNIIKFIDTKDTNSLSSIGSAYLFFFFNVYIICKIL